MDLSQVIPKILAQNAVNVNLRGKRNKEKVSAHVDNPKDAPK